MKNRLPTQKTTGVVRKKRTDEERLPGDPHEKREPVLHGADKDDAAEDDPDGEAGLEVPDLLLPRRADRVLPGVVGDPQELIPLIGDHLPERLDAGPAGSVGDGRPRGREVHRDVRHPRDLPEGVLHAADAGGAAHPAHGNGRFEGLVSRQRRTPLLRSAPGSAPDQSASPP